jgi:hypothetical protein
MNELYLNKTNQKYGFYLIIFVSVLLFSVAGYSQTIVTIASSTDSNSNCSKKAKKARNSTNMSLFGLWVQNKILIVQSLQKE